MYALTGGERLAAACVWYFVPRQEAHGRMDGAPALCLARLCSADSSVGAAVAQLRMEEAKKRDHRILGVKQVRKSTRLPGCVDP